MDLLARQKEIIDTIKKTHTNFNKDSATKKTEAYIRKRVSTLESLWTEFDINHANILSANVAQSDEYFMKDIFTDTKLLYERVKAAIKSYVPPSDDEDDVKKQSVDDLLREQRTNFRALSRQIRNINLSKITEKWEMEDEFKNLQSRWKNIDNLHLKIDNLLNGEDVDYDEEFGEFEEKFKAIKRSLNQRISSSAHQYESTPKVEVPTFHGDYTQWPTFLDLYKSSIHDNPTLSDSQKMQHLKGKLKGEAHRLVQHLSVSSDNYKTAWEILYHRYNNVQILFNKYIEIFLNQRVIEKQSSSEIKRVHDTAMECIHAIHNLGVDTSTWDPLLVYLLLQKLDPETRSDYKEARKTPRELPEFEEFMSFLEAKFTALKPTTSKKERESGALTKQSTSYKAPRNSNVGTGYKAQFHKSAHVTSINAQCILCNSNHALYQCRKFDALTTDAKMKLVAKHRLCKNCLYVHERNICNSTKRCKVCNNEHHTMLHDSDKDPTSATASTSNIKSQQRLTNNVIYGDDEILLTTVQIRVRSNDGTYLTMRALLDQGSQATLITETAAQLLGLPRQSLHASVTGVGISSKRSRGKIQLYCVSIHDDYSFTTDALVMPKLVNSLPHTSFDCKKYPHLQHIQLADPEYNISKRIDILLDAKVYSEILMSGLIKGSQQEPIAQQTKLGWILSGPVMTFNCHVILNGVEDIANYWEVEEIASETTPLTQQEVFCEELYAKTTKRLPDGRYEVHLPMKEDFEKQLGHSRVRAVAQFKQLESRLMKNDKLRDSYEQFIHEYIDLGHMRECTTRKDPMCYLPHHGVHKEDSLTTKLRVVFNASSKTSTGKSLNDLMECGPKLQQDIQSLLLRWRTYRYVYTADCEKMYRCILLHPDQQHLQKIIWRNKPQDPLKEYQLCTVTYGMKAAPYLAMRTMQQLALDDASKYPLAAETLKNDFYVDDLLSGSPSLEHAREVQKQLIEILKGAKINLRKWSSNCPQLLNNLTSKQINPTTIDFKNANSTKALGLRWSPTTDIFTFHSGDEYDESSPCTKRMLLSNISKTFDPLGWLAPLTIRAKLLFQKLWLVSLEWDDKVPQHIQNEWDKLREDLKHINKLQIPRWVGDINASIELHGFCDASERAYAAVVYLKSKNDKGEITVRMIAAKTKVAPRKNTMTLPRLELCGALLLSKLTGKILKAVQKTDIPIYGWTDSLVVLGWLQGHPSRWKAFIANRTKEILDVIPSSCWRHVTSSENAADCATRGLTILQLTEHPLWWEGPQWVKGEIPSDIPKVDLPQLEMKKDILTCTVQTTDTSMFEELLNRHSSISHAVRVIARVLRFITNIRHTASRCSPDGQHESYLTATEIEHSYELVIRAYQMQVFQLEINQIKQNGTVHSKSHLLTLTPYLDKNDILRVGGRLQHSQLTDNAKHPMILPKDTRLTELIVKQAHLRTLHGGPGLSLTYLRQKYWVLGGIRTVKKYLRSCVKCARFNSHNQHQIMADMPGPRVTPSRAYTHTGVDLTGQVELKVNKGRGIKTTRGYIAVFVCFTTKAIHLELVSDLSTPAFMAAFKRMCARRGTPRHVYSDNGTNFIGASRLLKREYKEVLQTINHDFLSDVAEMGVTWHLNVPKWPSGGGLWEAAVKSTKHHLKRVLGEQKLTFEEFTTLLCQIEACLNSRPLCALTENEEDSYLTPGHFLVGGPLLSPPMADVDVRCIKTRWQLVERMHRDFWRKWSSDYLQHLQTRSKWKKPTENLKANDIVLIKEDNLPPAKWAMGRIIDVHPGKDGHIRVVTLRTKDGQFKRPIIKLIPLPINHDSPKLPSNEDDDEPEPKKDDNLTPRRLRKNNGKRTTLANIVLLFLMLLMPGIKADATIKRVNNTNTLFFDKIVDIRIIQDQWKLIAYYNMTAYWQSITAVEKYIDMIKKTCDNDYSCASIVTQLAHEIDEIHHYNELLSNQHHILQRKKRGLINGVGYLANTLFGVLDDSFAQRYEQDIETVKAREDHLLNLFKNQTSLIEAENNILKRNEHIMNTQFEQISKHLQVMSAEINQVGKVNQNALHAFHILSSLISADVIVSNLRRTQDTLLDIVTDIYHGRLNIHLLTPEDLQQQLNVISGHLQDDVVVPTDNFRDLYGLLHAQAKVTKRFLIIEIKIPLLNRDQFELDAVIDIPQIRGDTAIFTTTETKYLAVNVKKDTIVPMSEYDINTCIRHTHKQILCPLNHPVYTMRIGESLCDMKLLTNENQTYCRSESKACSDRWIKLHTRDTWLYSCCTECSIRIICSDDVTTKHLRHNGLITLEPGCSIKGDSFIIYAQHDYANQIYIHPAININLPTVSTLNEFMNVSLPDNFKAESHDQIFTSIKQNVDHLKQQELEKIDNYDSTHYIIIYSILIIITIVLITLAFCNLKQRWCTRWEPKGHNLDTAATTSETSFGAVIESAPPSSSPLPRTTPASRGSVASVDTATSPTIPRKIHFNLNASTNDLNLCD